MVEITTLCERLRERYPKTRLQSDLGQYGTLKNPDGPEAATKLEQLTTDLDTVVRALDMILCCTPHARDGQVIFDCGDPFQLAREALSNIKREGVA